MIDTHAHLNPGEEIKMEGLQYVILSANNLEDSENNLKLAAENKKLLPAVGIHPTEQLSVNSEQLTVINEVINKLDNLIQSNKNIIAVGECGLDFAEDHDKQAQEILFRGQIALSLKHKKPLIVHSRKAMEETLAILASYKNLRGVIHCYTGGIKRIKKVLDLPGEFYFGIDGNLTYEPGLQGVVKNIPKDRLLLETDSPFLAPIPFRGEKNHPQNVKFVYEKTAEIWGKEPEETEKIIDGNAMRLFGI